MNIGFLAFLRVRHSILCAKCTKRTTTKSPKFSSLYFSQKNLTKNRVKWIFTNRWERCIIVFPNKEAIPRSRFIYSCTTCYFSAKYQSNGINCATKNTRCAFLFAFYDTFSIFLQLLARKWNRVIH